ncbi:BlaI/MecI/CopY family transcriptional regulator [Lysobacter solisilvae (ex Woo and Kim 2020)]|uniref:BlaI/MecI/CopY family transcriptional regulator n=1 Tax=Agrilutibacter terrestris TaxID=2865112 RepID=A0A7H0FTY2_9GAMM|nr:BlaI/MecI/CopY family transcriptional regulator [Lysobacter terrestris]QNP39498.1 BlaI/MecI/CopY family transcriptional regulator [Lysobacter terrestris]
MARPPSPTLTESERAILEVLWDKGEASVREVTDELAAQKSVAYTTVLTMFSTLGKKGLVSHRAEGRAFIYRATITREAARRQALDHLLQQFFDGSPNVLAQHLLSEHDIAQTELKALQHKVSAAKAKGRKP